MKKTIKFLPITGFGKWSVRLIIIFFLFLIVVASGQEGGETILDNLLISIPMISAGICAIASFFTGIISIFKKKERSTFVYISTIIGFLVLFFIVGEIVVPH